MSSAPLVIRERVVVPGLLFCTGWFGIPGRRADGAKVHAVLADTGKPLCGVRFHPDSEFQWCAPGVKLDYLECERCQGAVARIKSAVEGEQ
jgi:hypothetical protein